VVLLLEEEPVRRERGEELLLPGEDAVERAERLQVEEEEEEIMDLFTPSRD